MYRLNRWGWRHEETRFRTLKDTFSDELLIVVNTGDDFDHLEAYNFTRYRYRTLHAGWNC